MRKPQRWITYILIMAIMVCSTAPVFAEAWTSNQATQVTNHVSNIRTYIYDWIFDDSDAYTWRSFMYEFWRLSEFLIPRGSYQGQTSLWDIISTSLPGIYSYVNGYFASYQTQLTSQTGYLKNIQDANVNYLYTIGNTLTHTWTFKEAAQNSSYYLLGGSPYASGSWDGAYKSYRIGANGQRINQNYAWQYSSPLGNVALLLNQLNETMANTYTYRWAADLTHYNDNLTTWDSQGDTLQQVAFTPESAIQGLYRYLAFTQRDVARLTYVLASDEEITAREKARDNQNAVLDNFIDDTGDGAISTNDFGSVADASKDIKDNLNTGVSASGIFDVFTGDHTSAWFSQTTANELDRTQANRSLLKANGLGASDYDTPLLDEKMEELLSIFGGDDKK